MKKLFLVFLLLLVGCNSAQSRRLTQENLAAYPWQFVTPMPHGRYGHDAVYASANGKIYVMGGLVFKVAKGFKKDSKFNSWLVAKYNNGRYSNLAYDLKSNQWEYMSCVPGWRSGFTKYDPNTDQWNEYEDLLDKYSEEEILKMSRPIDPKNKPLKLYDTDLWRQGNGLAIALTGNQIFWTGGQSFGGSTENNVLSYDLITDKWPKKIHKNVLNSSAPKPFWEYDQREMYQTDIPPMQEPRRDHRAVTTSDGKIYVLGGWHKEKAVNKWGDIYDTGKDIVSKTMESYDPKTNKWEYKKPLSRERMLFAVVAGKDDKIHVFGGVAGFALDKQVPILNTVEVYDPKTDSWLFRKPMPVKLSGHCAVLAADNKIYIMGGTDLFDGPSLYTVFIYDPEKDSWEKGPDMILPRASLSAAATPDGKIYAIGGTDVEAYKDKAQWQHLTNLISADELGDYNGKVQDSVEVLDIYKWKKSRDGEKK
jgi:hypothetical protein